MIFYSSYEKLLILRFLFSKKSDGFISLFSWLSIIGITIGVAAIIIVMSVMNGFRNELTKRLLGINGHLNIYSYSNEVSKSDIENIYNENFDYKLIPLTQTQAFVTSENLSKGILLRGYDLKYINDDHFLNNSIVQGTLFKDFDKDIVIGYDLANYLGLQVNDTIKIAIPKTDKTIFGNIPRFKTLNISGIFNLGMYEYDSNFVFTHINIANRLLIIDNQNYNNLEIFIKNPNEIDLTQNKINNIIKKNNLDLYTLSWKENNASLINALNVEKNVMFLILTLIIIVASMNIISGLIIFVKEKNKDIGILKTIGLQNKSLIKVFLSIGLVIGFLGTSFGTILGILFSLNISSIQFFLEKTFNINLFSKEIYYLSNLPSELNQIEVIYVFVISIIICLIATAFPAYRSIKVDPITSLKND